MTKPYLFNDVFIQFFNYYATPGLIKNRIVGNPQYAFLADEESYNREQSQNGNAPFAITDKFDIARYPTYRLEDSAFWRQYQICSPGEGDNFWQMQVPFLLRLHGTKINLARYDPEMIASLGKDKLDKIKVDAYLLLNTLGWSVRVDLRVSYEMSPVDLSKLIGFFSSRGSANINSKPFTYDGINRDLDDVFYVFREALIKDGYTPAVSPHHSTKLHTVVCAPGVQGQFTRIHDMKHLFITKLVEVLFPDHEAILYKLENGYKTPKVAQKTVVSFGKQNSNFSVTDFNSGTFIFMQNAIVNQNTKTKVMCYSKNVCDLTYLVNQWTILKKLIDRDDQQVKESILDFLDDGLWTIKRLKGYLKNETCEKILANLVID